MGLAAQLRFPTLLVFARLGAIAALFWRLAALGLLFLRVAEPLLIIFQIAVERFDFAIVDKLQIVGGGADPVTIVRHDNQRPFKVDQRFG